MCPPFDLNREICLAVENGSLVLTIPWVLDFLRILKFDFVNRYFFWLLPSFFCLNFEQKLGILLSFIQSPPSNPFLCLRNSLDIGFQSLPVFRFV